MVNNNLWCIDLVFYYLYTLDLSHVLHKCHSLYVATETYNIIHEHATPKQNYKSSAGDIYVTLLFVYFIQTLFLYQIPYIGSYLTAWFYAFTRFDFHLLPISDRFSLFELHWEYMFGFGILPAFVT